MKMKVIGEVLETWMEVDCWLVGIFCLSFRSRLYCTSHSVSNVSPSVRWSHEWLVLCCFGTSRTQPWWEQFRLGAAWSAEYLCIYLYRGGGEGPSASILELRNNRCCLAVASGGNRSWLKSWDRIFWWWTRFYEHVGGVLYLLWECCIVHVVFGRIWSRTSVCL
jgi:hypothetical protein